MAPPSCPLRRPPAPFTQSRQFTRDLFSRARVVPIGWTISSGLGYSGLMKERNGQCQSSCSSAHYCSSTLLLLRDIARDGFNAGELANWTPFSGKPFGSGPVINSNLSASLASTTVSASLGGASCCIPGIQSIKTRLRRCARGATAQVKRHGNLGTCVRSSRSTVRSNRAQ